MKLSELEKKIRDFKKKNGDIEVNAEYWCVDCGDTHEGPGV